MNALIPDIETFKKVVKINASIPYEAIEPYIDDALEIYIKPYIGQSAVNKAKENKESELSQKLLRTLGPLTLMLAADEMGVMFGDSGITVDNVQGKRSPASDTKIAAAKANLRFRGMQALDRLITYLEENKKEYPDYVIDNISRFCFIHNAKEFQDIGMVDIDHSTLSFRIMFATIRQIQERNVREMIPDKLYAILKDTVSKKMTAPKEEEMTSKQQILIDYIIRYLANKTAELYTSQTSREQCAATKSVEFSPFIRPIYQDPIANGNFFAEQATYYAGKIRSYMLENGAELGIAPTNGIEFNSKEKKIFTSIS